MFFASSVIEGATKEAARQIRTGQLQGAADPMTTFRNELCDGLYNVIDCRKVLFHVQTFPSFETVSMPLELRSEEHTSELQSLMRTSYAVFSLIKKQNQTTS